MIIVTKSSTLEELVSLISQRKMSYDPNAVMIDSTETNIDYVAKCDGGAEDNTFHGNVFHDIQLCGHSGSKSMQYLMNRE